MRHTPVLLLIAVSISLAGPAQAGNSCVADPTHTFFDARPCAAGSGGGAIAVRVQALLKTSNDRKAAGHAENFARCRTAMQVAALCGTTGGNFSCDARGFRPASPAADGATPRPTVSSRRRMEIRQCALHATQGRP